MAWFPLLFYTTVYIGDLYKRSTPLSASPPIPQPPPSSDEYINAINAARDAEATRLGSRALFYSALLALFVNVVMPMFVATTASKRSPSISPSHSASSGHGNALGGLGEEIGSARIGRSDLYGGEARGRHAWEGGGARWVQRIRVPERMKIDLATLWAISHLVLSGCMLGTL